MLSARRGQLNNQQRLSVWSPNIFHSPIAEILKETEGRHFDSRLENEDGRKEEIEYLQCKLQLLCVTFT